MHAADGVSAVAFVIPEESRVAASEAKPVPRRYCQIKSEFLVAERCLFAQELLAHVAFGGMDVVDVSAECGIPRDGAKEKCRFEEFVCGAYFGVEFLAVRAEVATEALGVTCVSVCASFMVRIDPRFNACVFEHPTKCRGAQDDVVACNAESGCPFVAPPAIVEHACQGFHVVPQEFAVEFPVWDCLDAQIERKRDIVLVALQVFLENIGNERDGVSPFEFAPGTVSIGVRICACGFGGGTVKRRFRNA